jgi:CRISPR-associated protein Cas6
MPVIDLSFPIVQGLLAPADHAHQLLGALKRALPQLAEIPLGVHPLEGVAVPGGLLHLGPRAALRLRLAAELRALVAPLGGQELRVGSMLLRLGRPTVEALEPHPALHARRVVVAKTVPRALRDGAPGDAARRRGNRVISGLELGEHLRARCNAGAEVRIGRWQAFRLHGKGPGRGDLRILGAAVVLRGLDAATSLRLQAEGIGGRRAFGCGILVPVASPLAIPSAALVAAGSGAGHA